MSKSIHEIIQLEIKESFKNAKRHLKRMEKDLKDQKNDVKKLEKSLTCNHKWKTEVTFGPDMDICTKCGWEHWY